MAAALLFLSMGVTNTFSLLFVCACSGTCACTALVVVRCRPVKVVTAGPLARIDASRETIEIAEALTMATSERMMRSLVCEEMGIKKPHFQKIHRHFCRNICGPIKLTG